MSDRISFPSAQFPAVPSVSLRLPASWKATCLPLTLLSARRVVPDGTYMPNVAIRWRRVDPGLDLPKAAQLVDEGVAQLAGVQDIGRWMVSNGALRGYAREFAFEEPGIGTLAQAWRIFVIRQEGVCDVIEMVGTVGSGQTSEFIEVRDILDSTEISTAGSEAISS